MRRQLPVGRADAGEAQTLVRGLRAAFAASPLPTAPARWVPELSGPEREAWQYLQSQAPAGSTADVDITCLLAYCGVDLALNIRRLLQSRSQECEWPGNGSQSESDTATEDTFPLIVGHLSRLYDRWREPDLLEWLLDQRPRCSASRMAQRSALIALWDVYSVELLRAAAGHGGRTERMAEMIGFALRFDPALLRKSAAPLLHYSDPGARRRARLCPNIRRGSMRLLKRAAVSREAAIRNTALKILALLRRQPPARGGRHDT